MAIDICTLLFFAADVVLGHEVPLILLLERKDLDLVQRREWISCRAFLSQLDQPPIHKEIRDSISAAFVLIRKVCIAGQLET